MRCTTRLFSHLNHLLTTGEQKGTRQAEVYGGVIYQTFLFFLFFNVFLSDTFTCPILGTLVPLFWISGDVFSGFQSQSRFCLIHIAEANVMYIAWDQPLVLHVADLLTDSIAGHWPGLYLAQGYNCVSAVSLEPMINRSWVLHANHSATRPGQT